MPGVIAVVGVPEAARRLREAARPLLRRPTHRLELAAPSSDVAVGFVGQAGAVAEAEGVAVALDGELVSCEGVVTGRAAAQAILDAYLVAGEELRPPDGSYAAVLWNGRRREAAVVTDRAGSKPVFLSAGSTAMLAAGELKALVGAGLRPRISLECWAELLAFEQALGAHAPLEGVELAPAGTILTWRDGRTERREYYRYRLAPERRGEEIELAAAFAEVLGRAVRRRVDGRTGLALSGGLDSRCVASVVSRGGLPVVALTYGAPRSEDLRLGTVVARRAGLDHRPRPLARGYVAKWSPEAVWLAEGQIRCFHSHGIALRDLYREGIPRALVGAAGDPVVRWGAVPLPEDEPGFVEAMYARTAVGLTDELAEQLLAPTFASALRGLARESLARHLADEEGDPVSRRNQFGFRHVYRRKVMPGAALTADDGTLADPYTDADLLEFCRRLPEDARSGGALQRAYLARFTPLGGILSPKDGLAPDATGLRLRAATVRRRATGKASAAGRRVFRDRMPDHRGIGDYGRDLRRSGGRELLETLLERRTLARGQLREEPVRRLVGDVLAGRSRNTVVLGMLLTLELFQRQLVDGEEPALAGEL